MHKVTGKIGMNDNVTPTLKKIRNEQKNLRDDAKTTLSTLKSVYDKTWKTKIDDNDAYKKLSAMKSKMNAFKSNLSVRFKLIDNVSKTSQKIKNKLSALKNTIVSPMVKLKDATTTKLVKLRKNVLNVGRLIATPVVMLKDKATKTVANVKSKLSTLNKKISPVVSIIDKTQSALSGIGSKLKAATKKIAIPVMVAATVVVAGLGAAAKSGMQLEQQQISIKHYIGATNKNMKSDAVDAAANQFTEALRTNANTTPFETGEVIQAGSRAIAIAQGDRKSAMSLVTLAEDMAAASGGTKSISDAMEALADAKLGEMERLKEFGFKVSAEEFQNKGFKGISKDLDGFFGGASDKLAQSGAGLMSTIKGKLKSSFADFGLKIVDQMKPVLQTFIGLIDKAMPYIDKIGSAIGNGIGKGIDLVTEAMPGIIKGFQDMEPFFSTISSGILTMMPPIMKFAGTVVNVIRDIATATAPVITKIVSAISRMLPVIEPIFSSIATTIGNIVSVVLPPLGSAFSYIGDIVVALAPIVTTAFEGIGTVIEDVVGGLADLIQGGMDIISSIWSGDWQGVVDAFGTIFEGVGQLCKAPVNAIIAILNCAIDGINSFSCDIPDWVPVIGGQHWGLELDHFTPLAKGGVIDKPTPAIFGEAGREAVVPLEHNTGWMDPVVGKILRGIGSVQATTPISMGNTGVTYLQSMVNGINTLIGLFSSQNNPRPMFAYPTGYGGNTSLPQETSNKNIKITIEKFADKIVIRDEEDIDAIGDAIVKKLKEADENS